MKLLLLTQTIDRRDPILGFFHSWVLEFAKYFSEIHIICLKQGQYDFPKHVHVYSLGKEEGENRLKYLFRFYKYFTKIFFQVHVDYVFFHMGAINNILAAPFFLLRKFTSTQFYWWKAHGHINLTGRLALGLVDRVYTSTASGFTITTNKRYVVGQAIDTNLFLMPARLEKRKKEVVFVGRIMPVKHIEDFIDVAELLASGDDSVLFTIVGPIGDEEYYQKLKKQCADRKLQEKIVFLGPRSQIDLVSIYQTATVFLNTSQTHSMDKTVLEAVLCGCIPVTDNRAFATWLQPEGLYLPKPSAKAYAEVIKNLLTQDNTNLQDKLRDVVLSKHSLETLTKRIFNL